jgi:hypothetical protein
MAVIAPSMIQLGGSSSELDRWGGPLLPSVALRGKRREEAGHSIGIKTYFGSALWMRFHRQHPRQLRLLWRIGIHNPHDAAVGNSPRSRIRPHHPRVKRRVK